MRTGLLQIKKEFQLKQTGLFHGHAPEYTDK